MLDSEAKKREIHWRDKREDVVIYVIYACLRAGKKEKMASSAQLFGISGFLQGKEPIFKGTQG